MKERPILFSAPMVRAILDGTKTQTRRVVKPQPYAPFCGNEFPAVCKTDFWAPEHLGKWCWPTEDSEFFGFSPYGQTGDREWRTGPMPAAGWYYVRGLLDPSVGGDERPVWIWPESFTFGFSEQDDPESIELDTDITPENVRWKRPGDRLWVREAFGHFERNDTLKPGDTIYYRADGECLELQPWRPSIHMPRWASRITLEITGVRVERLQDISEADAAAEGMTFSAKARRSEACMGIYELRMPDGKLHFNDNACDLFRTLWEQINGPGSWDANPWVWVVEFRKLG